MITAFIMRYVLQIYKICPILPNREKIPLLLFFQHIDRVLYHASIMVGLCLVFVCHLLIGNAIFLIFLAACFGALNAIHNTLIPIVPVTIFGRENLPRVLGYELTMIGVAALAGPPVAGEKP